MKKSLLFLMDFADLAFFFKYNKNLDNDLTLGVCKVFRLIPQKLPLNAIYARIKSSNLPY